MSILNRDEYIHKSHILDPAVEPTSRWIKYIPYYRHNVEPTHRSWTVIDELKDLYLMNKGLVGVIIVLALLTILFGLMGWCATTRGYSVHVLSSEANLYEHIWDVI